LNTIEPLLQKSIIHPTLFEVFSKYIEVYSTILKVYWSIFYQ